MLDKEKVINALKSIVDAETKADIVSAGYVKNLTISPENNVHVDIEIPKDSMAQKDQYQSLIHSALKSLSRVNKVSISIDVEKDPLDEGLKQVKHIIAVASCKGGVGKSTTSVNLAFSLQKQGYRVGIFDADIYGPSLPAMVHTDVDMLVVDGGLIQPPEKDGVKLMSFGYTQEHTESQTAAMLRGPMVSQIITQLLKGTAWGELDYLIIDYPPGTGDTQLTLGQLIPIDAAVIVTTPQYISFIDVIKGIEMFDQLNIPTVSVVENMSYYICDNCDKKHLLLGESLIPRFQREYGIENSYQFPMTPELTKQCDEGAPFVCQYPDHELSQTYTQLAIGSINAVQQFKANGYRPPEIDYNHEEGITITYEGETYIVDTLTLRKQCQCAYCVDEFTGEMKQSAVSADVVPLSISAVGNYAIGINWSDDHSSLYPLRLFFSETLC